MWRVIRRRLDQGQLLPYRWTHLGGLLNTLLLVHLRRLMLRWQARRPAVTRDADITVLIGHRNRLDYRLINALRSITSQRYSHGRVRAVVVDYGSAPEPLAELRRICRDVAAECLVVEGVERWNRSHCLNVGIRRAGTEYLMVTDVDVILSPTYLQEAVSLLEQERIGMVLTPCLHLPQEVTPVLEATAARGTAVDTGALRPLGVVKTPHGYSTGRVIARTEYFRRVRGFDEWYVDYGSEDADLVQRLSWLGLRRIILFGAAYYLHQWHPRHEGVRSPELQGRIAANAIYLQRTRTIKRNPAGWGEARVAGEEA